MDASMCFAGNKGRAREAGMRIIRLREEISESDKINEVQLIKSKFPDAEVLGNSFFIRVDEEAPLDAFSEFENIREIVEDVPPYALSSRKLAAAGGCVFIGDEAVGNGREPVIIAGPCSVESYEQMALIAERLVTLGVRFMRAGAYKPRTSPYTFQGLKKQGLEIMLRIKREFGLKMVTEVMGTDKIDEVSDVADILQVGSRNMFHYVLLEQLGKRQKPVLLKRGMAASMNEILMSAEYLLSNGNRNVILCERGIKTFETATRNTLDLSVVPHIKQKTSLPIIVDPSHGTGIRSLVLPMALAALACGADGLIVEVHHDPGKAKSDGQQSITPGELSILLSDIGMLREAGLFRRAGRAARAAGE